MSTAERLNKVQRLLETLKQEIFKDVGVHHIIADNGSKKRAWRSQLRNRCRQTSGELPVPLNSGDPSYPSG